MRPSDWLQGFYEAHCRRHPRSDWPEFNLDDEFISSWLANFILHNVTRDEAEVASIQIAGKGVSYRNEHLSAILAAIDEIRRNRGNDRARELARTREDAARRSEDCPECNGDGRARRRFVIPDRYKNTFEGSLFCRCPLGRFDENQYRQEWPEEREKRDDLQSRPDLWDRTISFHEWSDVPTNPTENSYSPFSSYWLPPE